MNTVPIRHGDMLFYKVDPSKVEGLQSRNVKNLTVGLGEVTGHAHNIKPLGEGAVTEFADEFPEGKDSNEFTERSNLYFQVKGEAIVHHEEHALLTLEEGTYVRVHQRVYEPFSKQIRRVID